MRRRWSAEGSGVVRRPVVAAVAALTAVSGAVLGVVSGVGAVPASAASPDSRAPIVASLTDTAGGVRVEFSDRSVDEDAFQVVRRGLNGSWEFVGEVVTRDRPGLRMLSELVDPRPNALGCYMVTAYDNAGGVLLQSRSECVTGGWDPFDPLIARTTPRIAAPEVTHVEMLREAGGLTQVRVRYVDRSINESRFRLFRRSGPGDGNQALLRETITQRRTTVGQLLFFDDSVPTGTNPCYTIQALDDTTGLSNLSNEACLTALPVLPAPPRGQATNNIAHAGQAVTGSMVIGADGLPILGHTSIAGGEPVTGGAFVTHCNDAACATATTSAVDPSGSWPSIAIGRDGLPIISYLGPNSVLRIAHCADRACRSATTATLDTGATGGGKISIGPDGLATIVYQEVVGSGRVLKVAHCRNVPCDSGATITTIETLPPHVPNSGAGVSAEIVTSPAGHTYIATAMYAWGPDAPPLDQRAVKVTTCFNPTCTSRATHPVDWQLPGEVGFQGMSIAVGRDGRPVLSYSTHDDLKFAQCVNILCTGVTTRVLDHVGQDSITTVAIGADGLPVIAYDTDHRTNFLGTKVAHCTEPACRHASIVPVIASHSAVRSIAIDADGLPVIVYGARSGRPALLRCPDATCSGGPFPEPLYSGPRGPLRGGGKCAEVLLASTDNGTPIQLRPCSGHIAQNWEARMDGELRALGKCLTIAGAAKANGTPIQLHDCNDGRWDQEWALQVDGKLRNPASGKCLDTALHSDVDFIRLVLWTCTPNTPSQRWTLPTT